MCVLPVPMHTFQRTHGSALPPSARSGTGNARSGWVTTPALPPARNDGGRQAMAPACRHAAFNRARPSSKDTCGT